MRWRHIHSTQSTLLLSDHSLSSTDGQISFFVDQSKYSLGDKEYWAKFQLLRAGKKMSKLYFKLYLNRGETLYPGCRWSARETGILPGVTQNSESVNGWVNVYFSCILVDQCCRVLHGVLPGAEHLRSTPFGVHHEKAGVMHTSYPTIAVWHGQEGAAFGRQTFNLVRRKNNNNSLLFCLLSNSQGWEMLDFIHVMFIQTFCQVCLGNKKCCIFLQFEMSLAGSST